jgi:hypothetical protein
VKPRLDGSEVGFVRDAGRLHGFLPKVYARVLDRVTADPLYRSTRFALLARLLATYRRNTTASAIQGGVRESSPTAEWEGDVGFLDKLDAAAQLRSDFLAYGPYYVKATIHSAAPAQGVIDWSRTLRRSTALVDGANAYYMNPVYRARQHDPRDFFHRMQLSVVAEAMRLLGDEAHVPEGRGLDENELRSLRERPSDVLGRLSATTFRDRGRSLLRTIAQYLELTSWKPSLAQSESTEFTITRQFEYVWEAMLRALFQNPSGALLSQLSQGDWYDARRRAQSGGIRPRSDFGRLLDGPTRKVFLLFDAKDKPISDAGRRSASEGDHYKQIVYRQLVRNGPPATVYNILCLPQLSSGQAEVFEVLGRHSWDGWPESYVWEVGIDFETAASAYLRDATWDAEGISWSIIQRIESISQRLPARA